MHNISVYFASMAVFATVNAATASVGADVGLRIGVVNWDCSVPSSTFFGGYQTRSLGPAKYRDRTPYYANVIGRDAIDYPVRTLAEYEREMRYAIEAGIDYFAYCWYDSTPVSGRHVVTSALAKADGHTHELTQARRFHLQSDLRAQLGLCAILICCHPYSDTELCALVAAMQDASYEKVGGRPLVYLFEGPRKDPLERLCRFCRDAGVARPYVVYMGARNISPDEHALVDAFSAYACTSCRTNYLELAADSRSDNASRARGGKPIVPTFTVGWDPSPRVDHPVPWCGYGKGPYHKPATGAQLVLAAQKFSEWLKANRASCVPGQTLTYAWNEFEEGGWICPTIAEDGKADTRRLHEFAEAVKAMRDALKPAKR